MNSGDGAIAQDKTFVITAATTEMELAKWLEDNKPSEIRSRYSNRLWLQVAWKTGTRQDEAKIAHAKDLWEEEAEKSYETVMDIARKTGLIEGKYSIWCTDADIDKNWLIVAKVILNKEYGEKASVDCKTLRIRIFLKDFENHAEVIRIKNKLHRCGVKNRMMYRPLIFSILNIKKEEFDMQEKFNTYFK